MTMQTQAVTLDRAEARDLWRKYKEHQHYSAPVDREIQRTYQLIAQGRTVIRALDSIRAAGLDAEGFPKLAIATATAERCEWRPNWIGGGGLFVVPSLAHHNRRRAIDIKSWPAVQSKAKWARATVPIIPLHLRPKRGLANYHILWEADWHEIPRDPMLLRRIGKGDLWLVVAAWDLTEVERAALAARVSG